MKRLGIVLGLAALLAAGAAFGGQVLLVRDSVQVAELADSGGLPIVTVRDEADLESYSLRTGTRVGVFPAVVDEDQALWLPVAPGESAGAVAAELVSDDQSSRVFSARREARAARPLSYPEGVPEWAGRRSELTGAFEYLPDEELAAAWATNGLERVVFRNGTAADIAAIASAFGFTNEPVQWVELSKYLRDNRTNAAVVAAAVELNSLAMFYTSWGGDLFNVRQESTNCPWLSTERE